MLTGLMRILILCRLCASFSTDSESFFQKKIFYHSNEQIGDLFESLQNKYSFAHLYSIGKSVLGRDLYALQLKIPTTYNLRPLIKVTANIHGDETVGREIILYFAQYLCDNYSSNQTIQKLLNTTEIHLLPSCNPDGFVRSQEGYCDSLPNYIGRTNAAGIDLNRDFPDRLESQHTIQLKSQSRQPETAALIEWITSKPFVLSANFHGGAVVASYPYDNSRECCEDSLTPDDRVFKLMAHTYADNHPIMRRGHNCNDSFADGVTNGANWYELNGGMQDFNYAFTNCFELTIELSCCKYPRASTLATEWNRNKASLLELIKLAHIGIKGLVKDVNGYPINDANIVVSGLEDKPIRTTQRGEYWRLLTPGLYNVQAIGFGFQPSETKQIHVTNEHAEAQRIDFVLHPLESNFAGEFRKVKVIRSKDKAEQNGGFLSATKFTHHNFSEMEIFLRNIAKDYPSITNLYTIGKSVQGRNLWVMEIFATPGQHIPGIPEFKYVANMHGNEVVGKEMLLLLTKYICQRYLYDDRITTMVNSTRMHFLYSMNPDGYAVAKEGDKTSMVGRPNANNVDLNRNFPDQYGTDKYNEVAEPEVVAVMNWTLSLPFVLSANLHGGSLVANYPFDDNENDFNDPITRLRLATLNNRANNPTEDNEFFQHLAKVYSTNHPTMHLGDPCPNFKNEHFPDGITNGAAWYSVTGGMQDWNYVHAGVFEITIEMGCDKFPAATELPKYWADNREPLLKYIEEVHSGIHGFVKSSIGHTVEGAMITIDSGKHAAFSTKLGEYWKLSMPGRHNITIMADGFTPQRAEIEISKNTQSMRFDISLMRNDPQHWSSAYDYRIIENIVHTRYHSNSEIYKELAELESKYGQIATFDNGESEFGMYYHTLKVTSDIGEPEENKLKILLLSSFFDTTSLLGREITMNTIRHIIKGYKYNEPAILKLLNRSILHFLPFSDHVDEIMNMYSLNNSICDPIVKDELSDRLLSPEFEKRKNLFLQYLENENFDLLFTFTAGSSELSYVTSNVLMKSLANSIQMTEFNYASLRCSTTSHTIQQHASTERIIKLLFEQYKVPVFSLGLNCCRMPPPADIAVTWRRNIDKIKNFLQLVNTGISGQIQNGRGEPIRDAFVRLVGNSQKTIYNVSKNAARFQIILPAGKFQIEAVAPQYETLVREISVERESILDLGNIILSDYGLITAKSEVYSMEKESDLNRYTTMSGFVLDTANHPLYHARVNIVNSKDLYNYTDEMGAYIIYGIHSGEISIEAEASHHKRSDKILNVGTLGEPISGIIFRLDIDENIMGMSRLFFLIVSSICIIIIMVGCIIFVQFLMARRRKGFDKRYYNFSVLPQKSKELFEEDAETELFRAPIKEGMTFQPYYDEENLDQPDDMSDIDYYDSNDGSADEIIMLDRH